MKKLFISQPMKGKSEEQIMQEREEAIEAAKVRIGEDVLVLDTYFADYDGKPLQFLAKSLDLLAQADVAYFASGWQVARGCVIEHDCAIAYGITTIGAPVSEECTRMGVPFGVALAALKDGRRMTRTGWNGKGLFVVYQKGYPQGIPCNAQTASAWGMKEGEPFRCEPYLQINTVDGSHAMWVPSIRDLLAEDWLPV